MITYFLNWMGPIHNSWYDQNNIPYTEEIRFSERLNKEVAIRTYAERWCAGRIDVDGTDEPYGIEYSAPLMLDEDWNRFGNWLSKLETETELTFDELITRYYEEGNPEITWWNKN